MDNQEDSHSLQKVEDVSECIRRLATSSDPNAIDAADKLLQRLENRDDELKTKFDRTVININSQHGDSEVSTSNGGAQSQDGFMREIERDANERAERRERNRKRAAEWKDRGNEQFKLANYAGAVECYSRGLEIAKDFEVLYQNRANCYVKQGRYTEALADAEAAIFLTQEKCAKPFFHQAKALAGLNRLDEARVAYQRMAECSDAMPGHADKCTAELDRVAAARADEARALAEFKAAPAGQGSATITVDMLLYRLARGDQPLAYYSAGMRCLAAAADEGGPTARALFRAKSGFSLLGKQRAVVAALETPLAGMSSEQADLLTSALVLAGAVAAGDAENCHRILQLPALVARANEAVVTGGSSISTAARQAAMDALGRISEHACDQLCGREGADPAGLLAALAGHVQRQPASMAETAARLLDRLSCCHRLRDRLQRAAPPKLSGLVSSVESLLSGGAADSLAAFADTVGTVRRLLTACTAARAAAAGRRAFLTACETALVRCAISEEAEAAGETADELRQLAAASVLGLLACATLEPTPAVAARASAIADLGLRHAGAASVSQEGRQFALALLATLAPRDPAVAARIGANPGALALLGRVLSVPGHPGAASALRALSAAVRADADARRAVGDDPQWVERLLELVHSQSDCLLGNAALCLGHCIEDTAAADLLARTDIVRHLLCRMRDCRDRDAKANCAILCGKLAQSHHAHRERLRELDGVNILNSVLINNNIKL